MKRYILLFFILLTSITAAFTQELRLVVVDKPLNVVLNMLDLEMSFDDKAISSYRVSVSGTFQTPQKALEFLLKDKPFQIEQIGGVYVISPLKGDEKRKRVVQKQMYSFSGILMDRSSGERLPYAHICTDDGVISSDEQGVFSISKETNQPIRVQTRYIGFESIDTLLPAGTHHLVLSPKSFDLQEVFVSPSPASLLMQSGKTSGEIRINPQIARYMPGSVDNSVFNLLRMMPGVRVSGEPSDDLIVWGSNAGESQIVYDGFTLFGMKNFNDHISSVNPYLVKDIRLMKGGFDASYGDRIGAIAGITGNDGKMDKASVKANLSNYTANLFVSTPVTSRSVLSAAYRQTFYNLYGEEEVASSGNGMMGRPQSDVYIRPDYSFRDGNLKYAGKGFRDDSYSISLYGADDRFDFSVIQDEQYEIEAKEKNRQYGGAGVYNRRWGNGSSDKLSVSFSKFSSQVDNLTRVTNKIAAPPVVTNTDNSIQELSVKLHRDFQVAGRHQFRIGGEWQHTMSSLDAMANSLNKATAFITDHMLLNKLSLEAGVRADYLLNGGLYIQPRLSAGYMLTDNLTATASWGLYSQYLSRIPYEYASGGYQMVWSVADSAFTRSMHSVAGVAYSHNGYLVSLEGYMKRVKNGHYFYDNTISSSDNTIWGADLYAKKEFPKVTLFTSYSLVNIQKPYNETGHELKAGGIGSFRPFYFSFTYAYGTGFSYLSTGGHGHGMQNNEGNHGGGQMTVLESSKKPGGGHGGGHNPGQMDSEQSENKLYSRLDLSATYKLKLKTLYLQSGISLLNVLGTQNVKYNYRLINQDIATNIYTKATPFTPMVYVEIIF